MNQKPKSKPTIKAIIIVEGKSDTQKLKNLFNVRTIETNGSCLSYKTLNLIKKASKNNEIILFTDPDNAGEKIRRRLQKELTSFKQAFITKPVGTKKKGVAEASDKQIIEALKNLKSFDKANESISIEEYKKLNLNTKQKRKVITDYFKISECNNKQLFKRLNMMNITFKQLKDILK